MSIKIFYEDAYQIEFDSRVVETLMINEKFGVVLEQTCFYPEGGGQPGDIGWINGNFVSNTREIEGKIVHFMDVPLDDGLEIHGKIDWDHRFDLMQLHTAQHLLSASFISLFNAETNSIHFGTDNAFMDVELEELSWDDVNQIETLANRLVFENHPIIIHWIQDPQELENYPLRKPPTVTENIRIVEIENFDYSPCGGVHLNSTGQLGIVKIKKWNKVKENFRIEFVCGWRALQDYQIKNMELITLSELLSVNELEISNAVIKLNEEHKNVQRLLAEYRKHDQEREAALLIENAECFGSVNLIQKVFPPRDLTDVRFLASHLVSKYNCVLLFAVLNPTLNLIFARSINVNIDMSKILKIACSSLNGKGGGKPDFAQGGGSQEGLENAMENAYHTIKNQLISM